MNYNREEFSLNSLRDIILDLDERMEDLELKLKRQTKQIKSLQDLVRELIKFKPKEENS